MILGRRVFLSFFSNKKLNGKVLKNTLIAKAIKVDLSLTFPPKVGVNLGIGILGIE